MLIERKDRIIDICEMKFSQNTFTIDRDCDEELRNRISVFREVTGTKKALHLVVITTYGVRENMYSSVGQSEVVLDNLFERD